MPKFDDNMPDLLFKINMQIITYFIEAQSIIYDVPVLIYHLI